VSSTASEHEHLEGDAPCIGEDGRTQILLAGLVAGGDDDRMIRRNSGWLGWICGGVLLVTGCKDPGGETSESFGPSTVTAPSGTETGTTTEMSATDPGTGSSTTEGATSQDMTTTEGSTASESGTSETTSSGPLCGDGKVDDSESCDDGNDDDSDACPSTCEDAVCGDGFVYDGMEGCDDSNQDDSDGCLSTCEPAFCGDGIIYEGVEACDDGNDDDADECPSTCEVAMCGDGFVLEGTEECDDGNEMSSDGCTPDCEISTSCKQILAADPDATDGLYLVDFDAEGPIEMSEVYCDMTADEGGWMLLGKTVKEGLSAEDMAAVHMGGWDDYTKDGYGAPDPASRVYWMPLASWHEFTDLHLLNEFSLRDSAGELRMNNMTISDAAGKFKINWATPVPGFAEIVTPIKGAKFTTHDQDNDTWANNCAKNNVGFNGGWWYTDCYQLSMLHSNENIYSWKNNISTKVDYIYIYIREK